MYRIDTLLKQKNRLFHTQDLALLWNIQNENTLYTLIKRYIQKGVLIPVQKGLYSTVALDQIDPLTLGEVILHRYCYISCEYVLVRAGVIFQTETAITFVSSVSRKFSVADSRFLVRTLADPFLFNDIGLENHRDMRIASPERAAADLLYFNRRYHFDNPKRLDWTNVKNIQKKVGYA